jgi:LacI family transcriptional regulator, repressor for deo operon, udp, cdd, tsx, nupC, and nupG
LKKRTTIVDLAREAGVTPGTISRALSNDPRVKTETREKIVLLAKKLHYQPNLSARFFKKGSTRNVGFYSELPTWVFYNNYFGRLISGVAQAAHEDDVKLVFYFSNIYMPSDGDVIKAKRELTGLDALMDGRVDGAIVLKDQDLTEEEAEFFRVKSPVPLVLINNTLKTNGFFQLTSGIYERNLVALKYLFSRGHRRIGIIGMSAGSVYNRHSLQAFDEFYEKNGLKFNPEWLEIPPVGHDIANPDDLAKSLLSLKSKKVTVIVCADDLQGIFAIEILKRAGVRVPQDISILSFGQLAREASLQSPALTLVETDLEAGGRKAYEFFKAALDGKTPVAESLVWTAPADHSSVDSL